MSTTPHPQAPISPAQFELQRLRVATRAMSARHVPYKDWEAALLPIINLFEILLPDPSAPLRKPPLGLVPREHSQAMFKGERAMEIAAAIQRYSEAEKVVPLTWTDELLEITQAWATENQPVAEPEPDNIKALRMRVAELENIVSFIRSDQTPPHTVVVRRADHFSYTTPPKAS